MPDQWWATFSLGAVIGCVATTVLLVGAAAWRGRDREPWRGDWRDDED